MRYELRSIGVWSFVRTSFFLHLILGFVIGLFYAAMFGMMMAVFSSLPYDAGDTGIDPSAFGPVIIILMPILFSIGAAVFGTLFTAIMVIVYNMIVRMAGGLEFEMEPTTLDQVAISRPGPAPQTGIPMYAPPPPPAQSPPPGGPAYDPPPAPPKYDWTPPPSGEPHGPESENR